MQSNVGAGLPAMQTPRCISDTQVMLSQASQLPHLVLCWVWGQRRSATTPINTSTTTNTGARL
ncbi:hypothetical protein B7453_02940 [Pseudomonas sp. IB20]|nr:hypothetical protein B7453_02940 [Pseudomonas sp. IB20]